MKIVLIFCLILAINTNFIDASICLIKSEKIKDFIVEILNSIKEKNWMHIISTIMSSFEEIKKKILNCFEPDTEIIPEIPESKEDLCYEKCKDEVDYHEREDCYKDCYFGH